MYKVLVVDDSAFMRKIISDFIAEDAQFQVVSTAKNGKEAVEKVKQLQPDIITLDIEMPEMNGLEALRVIMSERPTPVIMLSSLTQEGARETIRALELGAIDFVGKPSGSISLDLYKVKSILLEKLRVAVKCKPRALPSVGTKTAPFHHKPVVDMPKEAAAPDPALRQFSHIVAIGTSTGGPRALQQVLSNIPASFPAPIMIVQHMPPNFTKSLAQRLDSLSPLRVVEAENGAYLEKGTAFIAPGDYHMKLVKEGTSAYRIKLSREDPLYGHRPSVDVMYSSLIPHRELRKHIVIMTGMGSDGARGMKALYDAGAETTIAEAEQTCIVYGMPRSAVELQCVKYILPLHDIAKKLVNTVEA